MAFLKFFLGAEGAALAFQKLQDFADWDNSIYGVGTESGGVADWSADPIAFTEAEVMDVSNLAAAVIVFKRSDGGATIDFRIRVGISSTNFTDVFFTPEGGTYVGESEDILIGLTTTGYDYLAVVVDSVSAGTLNVEIAPVPYEVS